MLSLSSVEKLAKYERLKEQISRANKKYSQNNKERVRELARNHYQRHKNDPSWIEKQRLHSRNSYKRKKERQKNAEKKAGSGRRSGGRAAAAGPWPVAGGITGAPHLRCSAQQTRGHVAPFSRKNMAEVNNMHFAALNALASQSFGRGRRC